jgi:hypothetical protein
VAAVGDKEKKTMRIKLFSSGSQYVDWLRRNCGVCIKANDGTPWDWCDTWCDIEKALSEAAVGDGTVLQRIAERAGYTKGAYTWDCLEKIE